MTLPRKAQLTFHEELWEARDGGELLRDFLAAEHIDRCFLLRELGQPNYELDAVLVDFTYDGSEKFLFAGRDWVLYSSHESSLNLAGRLAAFFRETWPDADQLSYGGPFTRPTCGGRGLRSDCLSGTYHRQYGSNPEMPVKSRLR